MAYPGSYTRFGRRHFAQHLYGNALESKYKPNDKSIEIIGLPSAVLTHITTDSVPGTLTETTFDTTSRTDSAQILLTNSTGSSKVIISAYIRGKPVVRLSDGKPPTGFKGAKSKSTHPVGGFLHDKFVDYERIAQDGDITFETGNNFVVTADQVNKLADYYWKLNRTKKHIYTLSLVGFQSWFEPGEWYTLQIGGVGENEYIDSTVECFDVRCSLQAGGAPSTSLSFREVEENWKFDSNEVARQIAAGDFSRRPSQNVVTVAAQYYSGYADYYCDGTDDQVEIQSAINYLKSGVVRLTAGDFNVTSSITISNTCSVLEICGDGKRTNVNSYITITADSCIEMSGSALDAVTGISFRDISFIQVASALTDGGCFLISGNYADDLTVANCIFNDSTATSLGPVARSVDVPYLKNSHVMYNVVQNVGGIVFYYWGNNIFQGNVAISAFTAGVYLQGSNNIAINNVVMSSAIGISVAGANNQLTSNRLTYNARGIQIAAGATSTIVCNNFCSDNGSDVGISNANNDNFFDEGTDTQWAG